MFLYPFANVLKRHATAVHHRHCNNLSIIERWFFQWIHFKNSLTFRIIFLASEIQIEFPNVSRLKLPINNYNIFCNSMKIHSLY